MDEERLRLVSRLVLALLLWQMEDFDASRPIIRVLGSSDEKDEEDKENDEDGEDDECN